jgi:transcription initiation factor TFIIE subunit alpha
VSAQATPSALSQPGSSDFGETEEEDRKPNVEYLDSLNEYRKRSRSKEDEGPAAKTKLAKMEQGLNGYGYSPENGLVHDDNAIVVDDVQPPSSGNDPIVHGMRSIIMSPEPYNNHPILVNGNPKRYSEVSEEDHELMTPEEYTAYFEVMQAQS